MLAKQYGYSTTASKRTFSLALLRVASWPDKEQLQLTLAHSHPQPATRRRRAKGRTQPFMPGIYEDVPIGDMSYDADEQLYQYQCPCGDLFEITL